jgi:hypothetical protein
MVWIAQQPAEVVEKMVNGFDDKGILLHLADEIEALVTHTTHQLLTKGRGVE